MAEIILPESLPNLPTAIVKIQKIFLSNNIDSVRLIQLLQEDPLLCANLLMLVNSPHYGLSKKVTSIYHAVMLLGTTVIRGITMAAVLKKSFPLNLSPYNISIEEFDKICNLRVKFLNTWVKEKNIDLQNLSSAAFLMASGKVVTSNAIITRGLSDKFQTLLKNSSALEAEESLFGINNYKVASILFNKWGFDDVFTNLIMAVTNPKTKEEKILHVISVLIDTDGILSEKTVQDALVLVNNYDLNIEAFKSSVQSIQLELR